VVIFNIIFEYNHFIIYEKQEEKSKKAKSPKGKKQKKSGPLLF